MSEQEHSETADTTPGAADGDSARHAADEPADDTTDTAIAPEFELVEVTYRGMTWHVPKDRGQWDMNVQFEFEENRRLRGFLVLLGGSVENIDIARRQLYSVCRTNAEVDEWMDHVAEVLNKECIG